MRNAWNFQGIFPGCLAWITIGGGIFPEFSKTHLLVPDSFLRFTLFHVFADLKGFSTDFDLMRAQLIGNFS